MDVKCGEGVDDHGFEQSHVIVKTEFGTVEVEDGVADELPGAVVGDIAAAVGLMDLDALVMECLVIGEDMGGGIGAAGDGDHRWMLDEQDPPEGIGGGIA